MEPTDVIAAEAERFAAALAACSPDAPVPTCPDWDATDLAWHLTKVHSFWAAVLRDGATTQADVDAVEKAAPQRPATLHEILPMRATATAELVRELKRLPDDEPRWSWWEKDQTVGFTRRMQLAEVVMHRVDAQLTAGREVTPLGPEVAAATIDHVVDVMHAWVPEDGTARPLGVVAIEATDTDYRALAEVSHWEGELPWGGSGEGVSLRRVTSGDPAATISGPVEKLALRFWNRPGQVEADGEDALINAVRGMVDEGIG